MERVTMADDDQGQGPGVQNEDVDQDEGVQDDGRQDSENGDGGKEETVSKAEFDKLFARMQGADRAKIAAENKLREKEQAELSELDRTKAQLEDHKNRADQAEERFRKTLIENAFHRENKFVWHDVEDAIAALDLSGVEVTEDGKVTGMADAIKTVAKKKPHYVKSEEGEGNGPPAANTASNGRRKGEPSETLDRKKLVNRFPALGK